MNSKRKALIFAVSSVILGIFFYFLCRQNNLNLTYPLITQIAVGVFLSSVMIIKAHKNESLLDKKYYSNVAGALIDLSLYSFVMLIVWLIFKSDNPLFQAVLLTYPLVKALDTFISNKFKRFMQVFVYYRKYEEDKQAELKAQSKIKAKYKKNLNKRKSS